MHSVGYRNSSNVIAPHVIPIAKKDCYLAEEATPSNCKSTSIACHQRRSYCTERVSGKGLALTWLKSWWLPSHLMHSTKPPGYIYVEKIPEQCCLDCRDSQGDWNCYSATKWFEKKKGEEAEENKNLEPWWRKLKFWLHLKFSSLVLYLKTSGSLKLSKKIGVMRYCKL